jgi:transcriptional regulator with XRE-family HTH domain
VKHLHRHRSGIRRARDQAERAAVEIRLARATSGLSRRAAAARAGVSCDTERRVEFGDPHVGVDALCAVGTAVGLDIVIRAYPSRPSSLRDSGQLALARLVCDEAHAVWNAVLEVPAGDHGEATDIGLFGSQEILATEIERLMLDFQAQYRRGARKRDELARRHDRPVRFVLIVEDTRRNRAALAEHETFIRHSLPAGSREVLKALRTGQPLGRDGLLWLRRRAAAATAGSAYRSAERHATGATGDELPLHRPGLHRERT